MTAALPDFYRDDEGVLQKERRSERSRVVRRVQFYHLQILKLLGFAIIAILLLSAWSSMKHSREIEALKEQYQADTEAQVRKALQDYQRQQLRRDPGFCRQFPVHMELEPVIWCSRTVYKG